MKYTFAIAALAGFTAAQTVSDIPSCALSCLLSAASDVGCSPTDFSCSCKHAKEMAPSVETCVKKACTDTSDQKKVEEVVTGMCAKLGISTGGAATSAAASAASSAASSGMPSQLPAASAASSAVYSAPSAAHGSASAAYSAVSSATSSAAYVVASSAASATASSVPHYTFNNGTESNGYAVNATASGAAKPSGTGATGSSVPFTGAASAMQVPAGLVGVLGFAAFIL